MADLRKEDLWIMADKLRGSMDAAEYKHVCLGLIFLKYISDKFENTKLDILKEEYAKELTISIKNNIKVDWDVRESVRAQMRITVKRLLRKYKYPPDKQADAVNLIIEQAEKLCSEQ